MKFYSILVLALVGNLAWADAPTVEISSFHFAGTKTSAAEICGKVTGLSKQAVVKLIVDEKSKVPGIYNTLTDSDGAFCVMVATYQGTGAVGRSPSYVRGPHTPRPLIQGP